MSYRLPTRNDLLLSLDFNSRSIKTLLSKLESNEYHRNPTLEKRARATIKNLREQNREITRQVKT